jgi:transcription termination factor Rho
MPVLTRSALEDSPLADLHELAKELSIDGFRKLRKGDLVDTILSRQGEADEPEGAPAPTPALAAADPTEAPDDAAASGSGEDDEDERPRRRSRRGGRSRVRSRDEDTGELAPAGEAMAEGEAVAEAEAEAEADAPAIPAAEPAEEEEAPRPRSRRSRGARVRDDGEDRESREPQEAREPRAAREPREAVEASEDGEPVVAGVVEVLGNGSGFLRVADGGAASDDDAYISAAQIRRCELVSGDRVTGPVRPPRRSERYPSMVRIDTINGRPADEVAEGTPFDELPATFPVERFALGSEDPTLKAIEWLTPIGKGSRVTITGGPRAGKSEALRRLAGALAGVDGLELTLVLVGVRPEELREAPEGIEPAAALSFAASADAQAQAVERAVDGAKRVAARGGDAVVLVDSLGALHPPVARRVLAAARNVEGGGSLTIVATAPDVLGGETTVIALDATLTSTGRLPALDLVVSGTLRPELLVGEAGADAIAQARAQALEGE